MESETYNSSIEEFRKMLAAGRYGRRPRRYADLLESLADQDDYVYVMIYPGEGFGQVAVAWPQLGGVSAYTMMQTGSGGWWHCVFESDTNFEIFRCHERNAVISTLTGEGWEPLERDRFRLGLSGAVALRGSWACQRPGRLLVRRRRRVR